MRSMPCSPIPDGDRMNTRFPPGFIYFVLLISVQAMFLRLVGFFMPIYFESLHFSGFQIGLYFSISGIAAIVFSLPMGIGADRISVRFILAASFLLIAASYAGFLVTRSFTAFCIIAFIGSFGSRFYQIAVNAMFFKIRTHDHRDAGVFSTFNSFAMGIGIVAGGVLLAIADFQLLFTVKVISYLVFAVLALFLPRTETVSIRLAEYQREVFTPKVLSLCVIFFLSSFHWGAEIVSYGPFLKQTLLLSPVGIGLYTGIGMIFVGIGAFIGMQLIARKIVRSMMTLLMIGFFLSGVFHVLMCVPNLPASFALRMVHEIGDGFISFSFFYGAAKLFRIDRVGGASAFITLWQSSGAMAGSAIFGVVGARYGHAVPLISSGIVLMFVPVGIALLRKSGFVRY